MLSPFAQKFGRLGSAHPNLTTIKGTILRSKPSFYDTMNSSDETRTFDLSFRGFSQPFSSRV